MSSIERRVRRDGSPYWLARFKLPTGRKSDRRFPSESAAVAFVESIGQPLGRHGKHARSVEEVLAFIEGRVRRTPDGCWLWTGPLTNDGYARMSWLAEHGGHRVSYAAHVGEIPEGLHMDHLCRNRACVNPGHLEPVTPRENIMRSPVAQGALNAAKTHCKNGHPYSPENTYVYESPSPRKCTMRICRKCRAESRRRWVAARRAAEVQS